MPLPERPQLHPFVRCDQDPNDPRFVFLWDRAGLSTAQLRMPLQLFQLLRHFDGRLTLPEIHAQAERHNGGQFLPLELFLTLAQKLDEAMFLNGPRLRELLDRPIREPSCVGCYPSDVTALRQQLRELFTAPGGPGLPGEPRNHGRLRAVLVPHMDYRRGGVTYGWGFKELVENTDASLFVIVGTSHHSPHRFTLTRKHFKTPLGVAPTDQRFIDRLVAHYGNGLFDDEHRAHLPEHSIELEVVLLQYLYEDRRRFRIVPLVVGSFHDCVETGHEPQEWADIARMVKALRAAEAEAGESVCYVISGDLAHVGPKFGDPRPVADPFLGHSRGQDEAILQRVGEADAAGYFRVIAEERDRRRICGLPPTYTTLRACTPSRGKVLHYSQYVEPSGSESVSFASVAFYA
jgi:MEMO1 family protein